MATPTLSDLSKQVAEWNARFPVGLDVMVRNKAGKLRFTQTRSVAKVYGDQMAAVQVYQETGWVALARVRAATASEVANHGH